MTVPSAVGLWHRAHLYKALACIVLALIALQYLLSGVLDRRSIETIFQVNATRNAGHNYKNHPRRFIIYGPVTVPSLSIGGVVNISANTTNSNETHFLVQKVPDNSAKLEPTTVRPDGNNPQEITVLQNATEIPVAILPRCSLIPPNLSGPVTIAKQTPSSAEAEKFFSGKLERGGRGFPKECEARYHVAIIVPYRARPQHLSTLVYNLHLVLLRQQIDYTIFIVEQHGTVQFNRAMLMNVGYVEALKEYSFDCFIFHDVDLLPEDDRNLYTCPEQPRHMSVAIDKFKYRLPYPDIFGGVSAMSREQFRLVNGFSNVYWGWGGEDDDMANRIKAHGLHISRYPANIARYKMLTHKKEKANPKRYEFLKSGKKRFATDGLTNLKYELVDKQKLPLYTWLLVKLTPPQPS
ncbi:beta-1,4-N-acetylgalactosaminyltransferase bre-4 isoform X2 [Athalia rosae]|nr:beta-1,4-N-acetylgalactosaminyltransferase bre-4 isoform X2 [Athalia rosae]XP_025602830.2 beta-1,4-N-acetylgalactosaminyltransferase bre-4 isoform X2 [Athalia rosae]XP_025602832.2 beta-1,4-N-acetylgalactosaminyltransferase bre-4 isoform X2 [Athalia rosae]XP_048507348.1 beta-1,4-N-acetylgalactosaminyltransferase bre-4 isoform X2 [Athalia rosae]XP_048507349.1 beta-1,4-N-acetylgalactosaminyltransferase bre-4 isoform X2 [Athalia rosae]